MIYEKQRLIPLVRYFILIDSFNLPIMFHLLVINNNKHRPYSPKL